MTASAPDRDVPPRATPPCGPLAGLRHGHTEVFLGVPYATAERFAPPTALDPWERPLDATRHRAQSPQLVGALERLLGDPDVPTAEACHHLEVFTPACDTRRRPVLVWIHGGAFVTGGASMPWYHGSSLCELGDVVVVTLNYRLGALGFAADTNCGLHDQVAALRWVAANIEAFGGDPSNVTVFGESAGGASAVALLAVPAARDLFVRAWAMSPSLPQLRSRRRADAATSHLLEAAGVSTLDELSDVDLDRLLAAQASLLSDPAGAITAFAPTVDGDLLPAPVLDAAATDPRPLVIGTTRDEMHLFNAFDPANAAVDDAELHHRFERVFGHGAPEAVRRYRASRPGSTPGQLVSAMQTDETFRAPARRLASRRVDAGAATWMYWFTFATPAFGGLLGSCHGLDIPFAFHNLDRPGVEMFTGDGPERTDVANEFAGALVAFARGDDLHWPRYDTTARPTRLVDVVSATVDDPECELRRLWDRRDEDRG
jgi:para-nitrobenzyl esterase